MKTYVLLQAVFENFPRICFNNYKLDPVNILHESEFEVDRLFKNEKCRID